MKDKIAELTNWLWNQGKEVTREALSDKLEEAYNQGRLDSYVKQVDETLDNILCNTIQGIKKEKKELYEKNFYNKPSENEIVQMKAYEYLEENLPQIIKTYRGDN